VPPHPVKGGLAAGFAVSAWAMKPFHLAVVDIGAGIILPVRGAEVLLAASGMGKSTCPFWGR